VIVRRKPTLAVVGATGAIGTVALDVLGIRPDVWGEVRVCASPDDAGQVVRTRGEVLVVQRLSADFFDGVDVAIFDLPPGLATMWAPKATQRGAVVIDNSTDFRLDSRVPLVVPEVNPEDVLNRPIGIIANPGATALTVIDALGVLHERFHLEEVVLTTFQAASGLGRRGMARLYDELGVVGGNRELGQLPGDVRRLVEHELGASPFPAPLALNVIPMVGRPANDGWTTEETKVRDEIRKILRIPELRMSATCVRVPVVTSHSVSVHARFSRPVPVDRARRALLEAPTIVVLDEPDHGEFPTPADVVGSDPRFVGRMRQPHGMPKALDFFITGDNLRSGAGLNLVLLAEIVAAGLPAKELNADAAP
jgi:aspartate-semialdehyde dehydrogenase